MVDKKITVYVIHLCSGRVTLRPVFEPYEVESTSLKAGLPDLIRLFKKYHEGEEPNFEYIDI